MGSRLVLLGSFSLLDASGESVDLAGAKAQALLAYLAVPPGRAHLRGQLAALLWGDQPETQARENLRQLLARLRRTPPVASALTVTRDTLALAPESIEVDVERFEAGVRAGTPTGWAQAAEIYRGDLLAGIGGTESGFEEWLVGERERLRELAMEALAGLLAHQYQGGAFDAAIGTATQLVTLDPLQESVHRTLMRVYLAKGRAGAALRQYQLCVAALSRELGTEPETETRELYREILRQRSRRPATPASAPRPPAGPRPVETWSPLTSEAPLVNRESETDALLGAMKDVEGGRGRAVLVMGEAGIGKSRLLAEFTRAATARGHALAVGQAYASTQILPFGAWLPVLQADGLVDDRASLAALPAGVRADLARLLPEFEEPGQPRPSGPADATRLFEAVAQLLGAWSRKQPLVVVLEDLHWADEMSLRLLAFVTRRLGASPLLLVGSAREEEVGDSPLLRRVVDELATEHRLTLLNVGPLSEAATVALVRTLAPAGQSAGGADRLEARVWAVSGGHPFVTVETVRAVAEGAVPQPSDATRLPDRVRQLVAGRRERLSDLGGRLADVAAVIGRDFEFALLRLASGLEEEEAAVAAEELVRRRVLRVTGVRFEFVHDRIREVVYDRLLPPRRVLLHRQVAQAQEALHAGDLQAHLGEIGTHYRAGEVWAKALTYLRRAGAHALEQAASGSATEYFQQALAALGHLPPDPDTLAAAIDLRLDLRNSLHYEGGIVQGRAHLVEAERLAAALGDPRRGGLAAAQLAGSLIQLGELDAARAAGERALGLAASLDDPRIGVLARLHLGHAHYATGDYAAAERCFRDNVAALVPGLRVERFDTPFIPYVVSLVILAWSLAERGAFAEALAGLETAARAAEEADHPYSRVFVARGRGLVALRRGDVAGAALAFEQARRLDRSTGLVLLRTLTVGGLGYAHALAGDRAAALPLLEEATKDGQSMGTVAWQSLLVGWLGEGRLLSGQLDAAWQAARDALDLAQIHRQRGWTAYALNLLGAIAARREAATAHPYYDQALALAQALGMRPLVAHCHAGLGALHAGTGDRARAEPHLAAAVDAYRALDMPYWLGPAEAALKGEPRS